MTAQTMTIYDPEGVAFEMEWNSFLDYDAVNWCTFCDETITEGWVFGYEEGYGYLIVCAGCARANATTEGR